MSKQRKELDILSVVCFLICSFVLSLCIFYSQIMNTQLYKYTDRIRHADKLIRQESTGTPKEFAQKLKISESYLYTFLDELKTIGLPLKYSKRRLSYVYTKPVRMVIDIFIETPESPTTR
jgi:hypothetical protein